jgi:hypothetical protein
MLDSPSWIDCTDRAVTRGTGIEQRGADPDLLIRENSPRRSGPSLADGQGIYRATRPTAVVGAPGNVGNATRLPSLPIENT